MILKTFNLPMALSGGNLYPAVRRMLPQVAERRIREAFDRRDVKMNGVRVKRDTPAIAGAEIKIYLSDEGLTHSPEILYEDASLLVVNKPIGLSCEPDGKGGLTVGEWVYQTSEGRLLQTPMPCHRLDNQTDGLLILAKNEQALRLMQQAFYRHQVHKCYQCLVKGAPTPPSAVRTAYLLKDAERARVRVLDRPVPGALTITTEYQVLESGETSRLKVTLHTGRTHQIRAHMAYLGHPLLGDDQYGDRAWNREMRAKRLMLCATELSFSVEGEFSYLNALSITLPCPF
ncbi:MAG TPA: RluA family pseudouridine synthase [Candidatus Limiplasma sp.]|nr:RluA family pseudouridine synthase [Candidatus Limiplasma sp.]HPS81549.1 RluA family pseudouridine synthase [Candidatus Limiplasma sp.]